MKDFTSYSNHIATASPTGTNKASYTPTNTALQVCPTVDSTWLAEATPLPPTPDSTLCDCIANQAACVVSDSVKEAKYGTLLGVVCGMTDCGGLHSNATTGKYGAYSMCGVKDQLAFALNKYYDEQDKDASACSFSGSAKTQATTKATGTCSAQIKEAGTAGTGTVSTEATATSGSGSSSTSSSFASPIGLHSSASFGSFQVAAYIATALLAGVGMIAL